MTSALTRPSSLPKASSDPLQLIDVDHVRFFVGNAKQAAFFYAHCFGFQIEQVQDLTTGSREQASYLLTQGNIRFVLTSGLTKIHPASQEVMLYGDGVKDVAFTVFDATKAYEQAIRNGGESAAEPSTASDGRGTITTAAIKAYGRVVHSFVSRTGEYELTALKRGGVFAPGFRKLEGGLGGQGGSPVLAVNLYNLQHPCGLKYVDHLVGNVEEGRMNHWVAFYENVLGFSMFKHFDENDISTEYSALMSKVMASGNNLIKMPINEPAKGKKKSQVQEYLDWHNGVPGVQHLALRTDDELHSISELRRRGVDFLTLPDAYYEKVWERVNTMLTQHGHAAVREDHEAVRKLGILVDADDEGYLLQLFTKPLQDRPTLFFEIYKRRERAGVSEVMNIIGDIEGRDCILVDDIVDSAGTLCNAAEALMKAGARSTRAYVTHGVLSGGAVARVTASPLVEMVITDSILGTEAVRLAHNIRQLSIAPLIAEAIRRVSEERSVSSLFN